MRARGKTESLPESRAQIIIIMFEMIYQSVENIWDKFRKVDFGLMDLNGCYITPLVCAVVMMSPGEVSEGLAGPLTGQQ